MPCVLRVFLDKTSMFPFVAKQNNPFTSQLSTPSCILPAGTHSSRRGNLCGKDNSVDRSTPLGFPASQVATKRRSKGGMVEGISKWHHEGSCPGFLMATLLGEFRLVCNPHVCHQPWPLVDVAFYDKASSPNQAQSSRMFSSCMNHDKGRSDWLSNIL